MLKRRRKLSKDLQIRKKITTFAEEKLHLGIIAQASLASSALDLHFLCKRKAALAQSPSSGAVQSSRQLNTFVN